jgi:hypothetical protein
VAAAFALVLVGVAFWEILSSITFDWSIVSGKRKWRWPMVSLTRSATSPYPIV